MHALIPPPHARDGASTPHPRLPQHERRPFRCRRLWRSPRSHRALGLPAETMDAGHAALGAPTLGRAAPPIPPGSGHHGSLARHAPRVTAGLPPGRPRSPGAQSRRMPRPGDRDRRGGDRSPSRASLRGAQGAAAPRLRPRQESRRGCRARGLGHSPQGSSLEAVPTRPFPHATRRASDAHGSQQEIGSTPQGL